uniref:ATP synthase F0 subunit 8 n=1 Tax=Bathymodiolus thermophilus TaxID=12966 RepID=A0A516EZF4_BATTH|nr:ATP synthase F0 subunit 8 [Bathymodiolus thermophilus]
MPMMVPQYLVFICFFVLICLFLLCSGLLTRDVSGCGLALSKLF